MCHYVNVLTKEYELQIRQNERIVSVNLFIRLYLERAGDISANSLFFWEKGEIEYRSLFQKSYEAMQISFCLEKLDVPIIGSVRNAEA